MKLEWRAAQSKLGCSKAVEESSMTANLAGRGAPAEKAITTIPMGSQLKMAQK